MAQISISSEHRPNSGREVSLTYLVHREGLGPIFSSVYVNPAERLMNIGVDAQILVMSSAGEFLKPGLRRRWKEFASEIQQRVPGGIVRLPSPPHRMKWLSTDGLMLKAWSAYGMRRNRPHILHCGGAEAANLALDLRKNRPDPRVVYHCWGPEPDEFLHSRDIDDLASATPSMRSAACRLEDLQRRAMHDADTVVCISSRMADWARQRYGVESSRIELVPCFVDVDHFANEALARDTVRHELGFGDDPVVAYCGSMIAWQLPTTALQCIRILRRLRPDTQFLGLTMHPSSLRARLEEIGFPQDRAKILSVPHRDVPRYLAAADLGILGRGLMQSRHIVHEISSPIKFGEYLACGTPVLMSEGVGDFSELAATEGIGVVLPSNASEREAECRLAEFLDGYEAGREEIRARCLQVARRDLDIDAHVARLAGLYSRLGRTAGNGVTRH